MYPQLVSFSCVHIDDRCSVFLTEKWGRKFYSVKPVDRNFAPRGEFRSVDECLVKFPTMLWIS